MNLLKKYWLYGAIAIAIVFGIVMAHLSFNYIVQPSSPYMIIDKSVPSDYCPLGYEPVELTGLPIEKGTKEMITCKVPESYAQYIHYPASWNTNPLNPEASNGVFIKYCLFGALMLVIGFIIWRSIVIVKRFKKANKGDVK